MHALTWLAALAAHACAIKPAVLRPDSLRAPPLPNDDIMPVTRNSLLATAQVVLLAAGAAQAGAPKSCPSNGPFSCQNTTAQVDTCCFNAPGGQLLQTQ